MKKKLDFIAIIPARAGSRGILNKNTTIINNKKLIEYTFKILQKTKIIKKIFLTTNDPKVIKVTKNYKKIDILLRTKKLSQSNTLMSDTICDALNKIKINFPNVSNFILLQPTSPQRTLKDIENAIRTFKRNKNKNLISISEPINHPYEMLSFSKKKYSLLISRKKQMNRQTYKKFYFINGSIFIGSIKKFLKNKKFLDNKTIFFKMDKKNSIDINDNLDKKLIKNLL